MVAKRSQSEVLCKKCVLKFLQSRPESCNFIKKKESSTVISCEYCQIFTNNLYSKALAAASGQVLYEGI